MKRLFDIISSFLGLIFMMPVFLIIATLIKIKMPGPVFFIQERVAQHFRLFGMVKFRTMIVNHHGNMITIKGEERITRLGAILRKYKLDELPQLWNVLKGDMSMVGPRPDLPEKANKLTGNERLILSVPPGITSPACLKYWNEEEILSIRNDPYRYMQKVIIPDKIRLNLNYIKNQSFGLDLKIFLFTIIKHQLKGSFWNKV
jgi:lipopolysaccharide/colanic/teichoic acid biosynthesis glycosyltransferase